MISKRGIITVSGSIILSGFILLILYYIHDYAPFGNVSLTAMDATIQYIDFFDYYKDILNGSNSIAYTFSKTLGGTNYAVFSYYLSSPFSLLVLFFDKSEMETCFNIQVFLKLVVSAGTFSFFLYKRFMEKIDCIFKCCIVILLSAGYSLCQYNIAQCSNIMWLDGVYMLPLILFGVYRTAKGRDYPELALFVGLNIIFNWYTAAVNCLFSFFWFVFELLIYTLQNNSDITRKKTIKSWISSGIRYALALFLGVMSGMIVLAPTIWALRRGNRSDLKFRKLFDFSMLGNPLGVMQGYIYGENSQFGRVALFAGSVAIVGVVSFFLSTRLSIKKKIPYYLMIIMCILMFYWNPLFALFSLFKEISSYWYRYSYLGISIIIFIAASFYMELNEKSEALLPIIGTGLYSVLMMLFLKMRPEYDEGQTFRMLVTVFLSGEVVYGIIVCHYHKKNKIMEAVMGVCLVTITIAELLYNTNLLMKIRDDGGHYKEYVIKTTEQINMLKANDTGIYRIHQTSTREDEGEDRTANYNEALAYNYMSISGYTSSPDDIQREFLERIGYRINGENMNITNASVISADALLGVKYILSRYPVKGLQQMPEITAYDDKMAYENPYALPMAFVYTGDEREYDETNPFLYQNSLYSSLMGEDIELFRPIEYTIKQYGSVENGEPLIIQTSPYVGQGQYSYYGNLPWNKDLNGILHIGEKNKGYSKWLSPSVFYIPDESIGTEIIFESSESYDFDYDHFQFYALNLDLLKEITEKLSQNQPDEFILENGRIYAVKENARSGDKLFLSVAYDPGWEILLNGKAIHPELFGKCLYSIDLIDGKNVIEMRFKVLPYYIGVITSVISILLIGLWILYDTRRMTIKRSWTGMSDGCEAVDQL